MSSSGVVVPACVSLTVFLPTTMGSKSSVASSSASAAAAASQEALSGFSPEERAALQWLLGRKEREPSKVCVPVAARCCRQRWCVDP